MKYVWEFTFSPDPDGFYPVLYSSFKKALYAFNDQYEFAKARGMFISVIRTENGIFASWVEGEGTIQEIQYSIGIEKVSVS